MSRKFRFLVTVEMVNKNDNDEYLYTQENTKNDPGILKEIKMSKSSFVMFLIGRNDAFSQNFMKLGLLLD